MPPELTVLHPGTMAADYIKRRDIVQSRLAKRLGIDRADFSKFLSGKKKLNPTQYILLAAILQMGRDSLIMQQAKYDYSQSTQDTTITVLLKQIEEQNQNGELDRELTR